MRVEQQQLREYLEKHKTEMLNNLCNLVSIPSVSSSPDLLKKALHCTLDLAEAMGLHSEVLLDGQIGVVEIGQGDEILGILAHIDVVSAGDRLIWKTSPYEPEILDGRLYGRGTLDDKGAIIACLYAMKYALDSGQPFHKKVRLILGTQEEVDWSDMRAYINQFSLPDYGFTPDAEYPICNVEKGTVDVDLFFPLSQPSEGQNNGIFLTSIDAGRSLNSVPGSCTAYLTTHTGSTVTMETVRVTGKSVHACQPEKGENAIFILADDLSRRGLCPNRLLQLLIMTTHLFQDDSGLPLGLKSESEYYNGEFVHKNVFVPTIMTVSGNELRIHINASYGYGTDPQTIVNGLAALASEQAGSISPAVITPAVCISRDRPFLKVFADSYEAVTGLQNEFALTYGVSYMKAMPNIVGWGPIFPGDEDTCHEENEYIAIDRLLDNAAVYATAIAQIAFTEESFR